jgi:hypothetical protein
MAIPCGKLVSLRTRAFERAAGRARVERNEELWLPKDLRVSAIDPGKPGHC